MRDTVAFGLGLYTTVDIISPVSALCAKSHKPPISLPNTYLST